MPHSQGCSLQIIVIEIENKESEYPSIGDWLNKLFLYTQWSIIQI
jgi:hypothetical protein